MVYAQFKGSLRDNFFEKADALIDTFKTDKNTFAQNLAQVDAEVLSLEIKQSALGDVMASISSTISSLWDML
jgi:hypothetical protein